VLRYLPIFECHEICSKTDLDVKVKSVLVTTLEKIGDSSSGTATIWKSGWSSPEPKSVRREYEENAAK
jgi:hypothetical protein